MKAVPGEIMDINHYIENKPIDTNAELVYVTEESLFSTVSQVKLISQDDLQQVRDWKNKVIEIRDKHKGSELYNVWDDEAKRVVEFLLKFNE